MARKYTEMQIAWMRENIPGRTFAESAIAFNREFGTDLEPGNLKSAASNHGIRNGLVGGRFEKGQKGWNSGTHGLCHGSSTSFKAGEPPHNTRPVGSERVHREGYIQVKVATFRHRKPNDSWVFKHHLVWQREHGPIPEGSVVVFKDGDRSNCDIDNLACISRSKLSVINKLGLSKPGKENFEAVLAICDIHSKTYALRKSKRKGKL